MRGTKKYSLKEESHVFCESMFHILFFFFFFSIHHMYQFSGSTEACKSGLRIKTAMGGRGQKTHNIGVMIPFLSIHVA